MYVAYMKSLLGVYQAGSFHMQYYNFINYTFSSMYALLSMYAVPLMYAFTTN